ncbi:nuclear transport factor 2 family protein [Corticibacterium sp. UT-5YL-CI-8]|nr:nuclear transport factor 2 family protein [Tianweitania sp. UT-5YL-CI-8]
MGVCDDNLDILIARDSLRRLVVAYSRAVDRRDFALLRSLYHDDAFEQHGTMFEGGAEAYIAFVEQALSAYQTTVHYVVNTSFQVSGDEAEGEIHKINYHRTSGDNAYEIVTGSRSLDRYRRSQGEWRFLSRSITLDWANKRPVNETAYDDFAAGSPLGSAGPDDRSYRLLHMFGRHDD